MPNGGFIGALRDHADTARQELFGSPRVSGFRGQADGAFLCNQTKLGCFEGVRLSHRLLGVVQAIEDQLAEERINPLSL
jgi:hypothetical protein